MSLLFTFFALFVPPKAPGSINTQATDITWRNSDVVAPPKK